MEHQERILFPVYVVFLCVTDGGQHTYEFNIPAMLTISTEEYQKISKTDTY